MSLEVVCEGDQYSLHPIDKTGLKGILERGITKENLELFGSCSFNYLAKLN